MTKTYQADLGHLLLEFYERFNAWEQGLVAGSDLSLAQMHALEMLGHMESPTMKMLAHRLGVTTGTLTAMIDRLEKSGLVARCPNPDDRRSYILALTEAGARQFEKHHGFHNQLSEELSACFNDEELADLIGYLNRLIERI